MVCKSCGGNMKSTKDTRNQEDFYNLLGDLGLDKETVETLKEEGMLKSRTIYYMNQWYVEVMYNGKTYNIIKFS